MIMQRVGRGSVLRLGRRLSTHAPKIPRTFEELAKGDPDSAGLARSAQRVGGMLGEAMKKHAAGGEGLLDRVEALRKLSLKWRSSLSAGEEEEAIKSFDAIFSQIENLGAKELRDVGRSFAHFLALLNAAEQEYRVRRLERRRSGPLYPDREDSCAGTIRLICEENPSIDPMEIFDQLSKQQVEIVLTAHPTEVHRRTLLAKHRRVAELIRDLEDRLALIEESPNKGPTTEFESTDAERELRSVVHALWGSDDLRRAKPTPQKEARGGLAFIETSLWDAVPKFLRRLDAVARTEFSSSSIYKNLPLTASPLKFSSWMGGDRDGNPNVTYDVTREVVAAQRRKGAAMFLGCLDFLRLDVSVRDATDEFRRKYLNDTASEHKVVEPYLAVFDALAARLRATVRWADAELNAIREERKKKGSQVLIEATDSLALSVKDVTPYAGGLSTSSTDDEEAKPLFDSKELLHVLVDVHRSLEEQGYMELADGRLKDTIRRVACFGLQLAPLDIRQESTRHTNALDAVFAATGRYSPGDYTAMSTQEKLDLLSTELNQDRPLLRYAQLHELVDESSPRCIPDPVDRDTLATCIWLATAPKGTVNAYVISQAKSAADVLSVELLLSEAGIKERPRIVPLFETLDDLNNAPDQLEALFSAPGYLSRVRSIQEIMVGYSDSAKDAGRLAASWAQYQAQEAMIKVANKHKVQTTFFHGKGGTVGRGGNPETYKAIMSHPPGTIQGRFRITEQGEQIAFNFGETRLAQRTLDIFTAAVLRDAFRKPDKYTIKDEWRSAMDQVSALSRDEYRQVVRHTPDFVPYFRSATPELELAALNVGSRPAKRNPKGGVESLRAIPWIFSWSQNRNNCPAWLGVSKLAEVDQTVIQDMYQNWPWFKTNIDLIETLLARTEPHIAALYDRELVDDPKLRELGIDLRSKLDDTVKALLNVSKRPYPASDNFLLQRALTLRNPYVDVLNLIQVKALKARRNAEKNGQPVDPDITDALLVAINGIAAGLRNSG